MEQHAFTACLAGLLVDYHARDAQTARYFRAFAAQGRSQLPPVALTEEDLNQARQAYPPMSSPALVEFHALAPATADALLPHRRCVFHGTAFIWRGRAWIFTAPSGTGKTTQYILWKSLYGEQIQMLNGDKPILAWAEDGQLWVHPSPWTGKEGMGRGEAAPLGGVIYLAQGRENTIAPLAPAQAAAPLFCQFLFSAATAAAVEQACALEEQLLATVPVWLLVNRGDEASARLTHDTILQWEGERNDP